jgi:hypothetical protein
MINKMTIGINCFVLLCDLQLNSLSYSHFYAKKKFFEFDQNLRAQKQTRTTKKILLRGKIKKSCRSRDQLKSNSFECRQKVT